MNISLRRTVTTAAALGLAAAGALTVASPANAAEGDSNCGSGDVCLYWGQNRSGAVAAFYWDNANHGNYRFTGSGNGSGERVEDNVASVENKGVFMDVDIFTDRNYGGISQMIENGDWENLTDSLRNKNSSHWFD